MKKNVKKLSISLICAVASVSRIQLAMATDPTGDSLKDLGFDSTKAPNLPTLGLENVNDPIKAIDSVLLNFVINPIFFLSGGVAVIVIMYAAFQLMKGQGEEEGLTNTKNTLIWAFAGLGLVLLSYAIVTNLVQIVLTEL
jgi:hypothetical protein